MKKLFLLCAFLFISMEIQAQLYIVETHEEWGYASDILDYAIVIHQPNGEINVIEIDDSEIWDSSLSGYNTGGAESKYSYLIQRTNIELNTIISEGYQIFHIRNNSSIWDGVQYFLAVPWTTVGLTEIDSSELDFRISPNPAKEYINVEVDFKSQPSELVLISEGGYVYFKKDISNVMSGQEFRLDISNMPAGKYLVTVKDDIQYLTPKKLIVF